MSKMDIKEFRKAVEVLEKEKGINEDVIYDAMELALTSAYKKNYHSLSNVRVDIDRETGDMKVFSFKTVVHDPDEFGCINQEEVDAYYQAHMDDDDEEEENEDALKEEEVKPIKYDPRIHLTLEEAQKIVPGIEIGETIEEEVTPRDFGRVAASTAKQVVVQKIREAERNNIINEFSDKEGEMVSGMVEMEDVRNYYINLGRTQGILPKTEVIPGETIKMGSSLKVYISKVENNSKGPLILLSRNHYGFVKRLFELEIPEINDGTILVYSVAREAGVRSKVAVYSEVMNVDPVGACIGEHGSRINRIIDELSGEKIDIIPYDRDEMKFIENALSPARNLHVCITDEKKKTALVIVDNENLSLAIGKKGLNVRLAARLTHFKIDVKTYEQAREDGINIIEG
ncbi:MAG: transcription termination/antitermination protein NusA [Firmicutes bacterium]|nr:transcription termination/antitermination protein NusA [Bacillota bacterium]